MTEQTLNYGDVVQISPEHDVCFGGCFMLVTEPKSWGAIGFVSMPHDKDKPPNAAYYRCPWDGMEFVGSAPFVPERT